MTDDPPSTVRMTILGEPASKANSRRWTGRLFIKSKKALDYEKAFRAQAKPLERLLEGDLKVTIRIWYASRRPDLDPSLILDLLQGIVYTNDRQVREQHLYWGLDKENPRAEIIVESIA